jgi:hypothetical protein
MTTTTDRFEDRHRELRELDNPYVGHRSHPAAEDFEARTGPLVDDLVAAVRGQGHVECGINRFPAQDCDCPIRLIAALDEAARA